MSAAHVEHMWDLQPVLLFASFFGGGGGDMEEEDRVQKGHTIHVDLYVSLADLYIGKEVKVSFCQHWEMSTLCVGMM
jgi:DnaJ-class molecular chaperone